jgi:hypothetical protein
MSCIAVSPAQNVQGQPLDERHPREDVFMAENSRKSVPDRHDDDALGAVEGEKPTDPQRGNPNAPGVDSEGRPNDPVLPAQDRMGANLD